MKSKLLGVVVILVIGGFWYVNMFSTLDEPYVLTYQQVKDIPQVIGIDEDFNLSSRSSDSMYKMSNRVNSLVTGAVISSNSLYDEKYDLCVNDDCVDLEGDDGFSSFIYRSLTDDIYVRTINMDEVELLRVSDMKKLIVDSFIGLGGVSSSSSYYFSSDNDVIQVDKSSFEVVNVYDNAFDLVPVVVDNSLYFYQSDKQYLQVYDDVNMEYVDSSVVNNVVYLDGVYNVEEVYINGEQFYMLDVNGYEVVITDFKNKVVISNNDYDTYGNPVYFNSINGDAMIMVLGDKSEDGLVYYEFYELDNELNSKLINTGSTKYNIGIDPQVAMRKD